MRRNRQAFTLLELIVVITIIGILGTLVAVRVSRYIVDTRRIKVQSDLKSIVRASQLYQVEHGAYPDDLSVLKISRDGKEPLLGATLDPWGREYFYGLGSNGRPLASCLGSDGAPGGEGEAADLEEPGPEEGA